MERTISTQLEKVLTTPELAGLGPGPRPGVQPEPILNKALDEVFSGSQLARERQQLVRALVLLWHDHLDAGHSIAQALENSDGAFVHGIMHRREPDYSNAAYWFRRVGKHPGFAEIAGQSADLLRTENKALLDELAPGGEWDPFGFIHACERANRKGGAGRQVVLLQQVQRIETAVLLNRFTLQGTTRIAL
jgi:hypothetical protein